MIDKSKKVSARNIGNQIDSFDVINFKYKIYNWSLSFEYLIDGYKYVIYIRLDNDRLIEFIDNDRIIRFEYNNYLRNPLNKKLELVDKMINIQIKEVHMFNDIKQKVFEHKSKYILSKRDISKPLDTN